MNLTILLRIRLLTSLLVLGAGLAVGGCADEPKDAADILREVDQHVGKRITMKAKFRPGIRCRLETEDGEWATYCRDCQICRGPYVVDVRSDDLDDWPMILAGTWKQKDIRCSGPLNAVECYPFELGKTYVVEGVVERSSPPKLYVDGFREVPGT